MDILLSTKGKRLHYLLLILWSLFILYLSSSHSLFLILFGQLTILCSLKTNTDCPTYNVTQTVIRFWLLLLTVHASSLFATLVPRSSILCCGHDINTMGQMMEAWYFLPNWTEQLWIFILGSLKSLSKART